MGWRQRVRRDEGAATVFVVILVPVLMLCAGLVLDGGLEIRLSRRFSVVGDARYTPIETHARATFTGTGTTAQIAVKPLVVSTGIAFHF